MRMAKCSTELLLSILGCRYVWIGNEFIVDVTPVCNYLNKATHLLLSILIPNQCFLFQLQLMKDDFETLKEEDLEFFFSRDKAILGWNGLPHPNPKTIFIPQLLDVPEIKSQFSGREGFQRHFAEMLGNQTGEKQY